MARQNNTLSSEAKFNLIKELVDSGKRHKEDYAELFSGLGYETEIDQILGNLRSHYKERIEKYEDAIGKVDRELEKFPGLVAKFPEREAELQEKVNKLKERVQPIKDMVVKLQQEKENYLYPEKLDSTRRGRGVKKDNLLEGLFEEFEFDKYDEMLADAGL